ncbi:MAG: hypothetical protein CMC79_05715 [Flavobacteriaceae bacterium]|nr:hypothetical protein [Flavobacteriaceae bacterium]|tara:strand:+ start:847 stop:1692 length:846 start_codon:yes stop_codon:yes gene_type:complete
MISINGNCYDNYNDIPKDLIQALFLNPIFEFQLRWESTKIIFWEQSYFLMMSQLRRLKISIPMEYNLDYFVSQIKILTNKKSNDPYLINLNFATLSKPFKDNSHPDLITSITINQIDSIQKTNNPKNNKLSVFNERIIIDNDFSSITYTQRSLYQVALVDALENNYTDNIIINNNNKIISTAIGNIFVLKEGSIKTPPTNIGAPSSVFRSEFIDYIDNNTEFKINEVPFDLFEIQLSDELCVLSLSNGLQIFPRFRGKDFENKTFSTVFSNFLKHHKINQN